MLIFQSLPLVRRLENRRPRCSAAAVAWEVCNPGWDHLNNAGSAWAMPKIRNATRRATAFLAQVFSSSHMTTQIPSTWAPCAVVAPSFLSGRAVPSSMQLNDVTFECTHIVRTRLDPQMSRARGLRPAGLSTSRSFERLFERFGFRATSGTDATEDRTSARNLRAHRVQAARRRLRATVLVCRGHVVKWSL